MEAAQRIELVDDTLTLNEEFKKNVAIPYFKDIYKDLVQQSDNKQKGINKLSILTVSYERFCSLFTSSHVGGVLLTITTKLGVHYLPLNGYS